MGRKCSALYEVIFDTCLKFHHQLNSATHQSATHHYQTPPLDSNLRMAAARFFNQAVRQLRPLQPTLAASRPKIMRPSLVIRAMSSDGGQITSELVQRMQTKIQEALQAQRVEVADMAGDGRHVEILVIAKEFEGKSAVNRQRMVYKVTNYKHKLAVTFAKLCCIKLPSASISNSGQLTSHSLFLNLFAGYLGRASRDCSCC